MNLVHGSDGAVPDPFAHQTGPFTGVSLVAHLGDYSGLLGFLGQHPGFFNRMG